MDTSAIQRQGDGTATAGIASVSGSAPVAGSAPVTVLIVDDCRSTRMLSRGALKGAEFVIREAADGCEGLVAVEQEPPDVILMDVIMPNMDGLECTRRLKSNPATRDIPVIIVSGCTDAAEVHAGLAAGADEYLAKPFSVAELRVRVRSMVCQRRNQKELILAREREAATRALEAELVDRRRIEDELRAAKEAAEVASRAKSDFLATMSH